MNSGTLRTLANATSGQNEKLGRMNVPLAKLGAGHRNISQYQSKHSQFLLLRRGHSDWSASSGQPSYYFLWPVASGRARTECDIVLFSLC